MFVLFVVFMSSGDRFLLKPTGEKHHIQQMEAIKQLGHQLFPFRALLGTLPI